MEVLVQIYDKFIGSDTFSDDIYVALVDKSQMNNVLINIDIVLAFY